MAQWRPLHRRITKSDKLLALARLPYARALYMELLPYTDREGRLNANPAGLSGTVFEGYGYSPTEIEGWLRELARVGLVVLYRTPRHELLVQYLKFVEMCKPDKREPESDLPGPEEPGSTVLEASGGGTGKEPGSLQEESAKVPGNPPGDFAETPRPDVHVHVHGDVHVQENPPTPLSPAKAPPPPSQVEPAARLPLPKASGMGKGKSKSLQHEFNPVTVAEDLPAAFDHELFVEFCDMRLTVLKKPLTLAALKLFIAKHKNHTKPVLDEMFRNAIIGNWQDLYPLRDDSKPGSRGSSDSAAAAADWQALLALAKRGVSDVSSLSPPAQAAVRAIGGWRAVAQAEGAFALRKAEADFLAAHRDFTQQQVRGEAAA